MGHVVLQGNQHDGGEGHDPQQRIAVFRSRCEVARPVARIDETDGHEQPRADVLENIQGSQHTGMVLAFQFF